MTPEKLKDIEHRLTAIEETLSTLMLEHLEDEADDAAQLWYEDRDLWLKQSRQRAEKRRTS